MHGIALLAGIPAKGKRAPWSGKVKVSEEDETLNKPQLTLNSFPQTDLRLQVKVNVAVAVTKD